jgi:hypothetical protein
MHEDGKHYKQQPLTPMAQSISSRVTIKGSKNTHEQLKNLCGEKIALSIK